MNMGKMFNPPQVYYWQEQNAPKRKKLSGNRYYMYDVSFYNKSGVTTYRNRLHKDGWNVQIVDAVHPVTKLPIYRIYRCRKKNWNPSTKKKSRKK